MGARLNDWVGSRFYSCICEETGVCLKEELLRAGDTSYFLSFGLRMGYDMSWIK